MNKTFLGDDVVISEHHLLSLVPEGLLIGDTWHSSSQRFDVIDPSTGGVLKEVSDAGHDDAHRAIEAAAAAAESWAARPPRARSDILRAAFELVRQRAEEFALLITLEMGKPLAESRSEVAYGNEFLRWFSEEAVRSTGRYGSNPEGTGTMVVSRHPVGPSYLITPWNFPLAMATRKIAPALAAGCTVVIKPSELTPLTTLLLADVLQTAGVPDGVVNVITTTRASEVTEAIMGHPALRKLSFTGSTAVGKRLLEQAAPGILRTSMELGGNAPFLVFDDADLDRAVIGALQAKFRNIGQACTAANRFLVHDRVADEFAARLTAELADFSVGRGTDPQTTIGPLIDERAIEKSTRLVDDATGRGARLLAGGGRIDRAGTFFEPTLIDDLQPGSAIETDEIFGPVLAIRRFSDEDEAVRLANATEYGLVAYAYTSGLDRAHRLIQRLDTGMIGMNTGLVSNAAAPFGGTKQSGIGREGGVEGMGEYLTTQYTLLG